MGEQRRIKDQVLRGGRLAVYLLVLAPAGLALVLLLLAVLAYVIFVPADRAPPADSHLRRVVNPIPAADNAFPAYEKAGEMVDIAVDGDDVIWDIIDGTAWDEERVAQVLADNAEVLALVAEGNRHDRCVPPPVTSYEDPLPYLSEWREITRVQQLELEYHGRRDEQDAVVTSLDRALRFVELTEAEPSYDIGGSYARARRWFTLTGLRRAVYADTLDDAHLLAIQERLTVPIRLRDGLRLAIRTEYGICADLCDMIEAERVDFAGEGFQTLAPGEAGKSSPLYRWLIARFWFPNYVKADMVTVYDGALAATDHTYAGAEFVDVYVLLKTRHQQSYMTTGLEEILAGVFLRDWSRPLASVCRAEAAQRATIAVVAIHRWRLAHDGGLPPDLAALVPEYLAAVPIDPFDGKPLRYDRDRAIVYSVGKDLADDGGQPSWAAARGEDVVIGIVAPILPPPEDDAENASAAGAPNDPFGDAPMVE